MRASVRRPAPANGGRKVSGANTGMSGRASGFAFGLTADLLLGRSA